MRAGCAPFVCPCGVGMFNGIRMNVVHRGPVMCLAADSAIREAIPHFATWRVVFSVPLCGQAIMKSTDYSTDRGQIAARQNVPVVEKDTPCENIC